LDGQINSDARNKLSTFLDYLQSTKKNTKGAQSDKTIKNISHLLWRTFDLLTTNINSSAVVKHLIGERLVGFQTEIKETLGIREHKLLENLLKVISLSKNKNRSNLLCLLRDCDFTHNELSKMTKKLISEEDEKSEMSKKVNKMKDFPCVQVYKDVMINKDINMGDYKKSRRNKYVMKQQTLFEIIHLFFQINSHPSPISNKFLDECFILHLTILVAHIEDLLILLIQEK